MDTKARIYISIDVERLVLPYGMLQALQLVQYIFAASSPTRRRKFPWTIPTRKVTVTEMLMRVVPAPENTPAKERIPRRARYSWTVRSHTPSHLPPTSRRQRNWWLVVKWRRIMKFPWQPAKCILRCNLIKDRSIACAGRIKAIFECTHNNISLFVIILENSFKIKIINTQFYWIRKYPIIFFIIKYTFVVKY